MHALVQRAVRDAVAPERLVDTARVAADALLEIRPLNDVGESLGEVGLLASALDHFNYVYDRARTRLSPDHRDTLVTRAALVHVRLLTGDAVGATADAGRLISDQRRALGPDNSLSWRPAPVLGDSLGEAGDAAAAVEEFENVHAGRERTVSRPEDSVRRPGTHS